MSSPESRKSIPPPEYLSLFRTLKKDGYQFVRFIGDGGGGAVFEVYCESMGSTVALKSLNRKYLLSNPDLAHDIHARFVREINTVNKLSQLANVATYHRCSLEGPHPYFTMEIIDGPNFAQVMQQQERLNIADACDVVYQCAATLEKTWELRLVHRDIKPSNLMLQEMGVVVVIDWGIAKAVEGAIDTTITNPQQMLGTVDFIAPEQIAKSSKPDIRVDLYSLGGTFYYLLTGQTPFHDSTDKIAAHRFKSPTPVKQIRAEVPEKISRLIREMLAKNPTDRPSGPGEVCARLQEFTENSDLLTLYANSYRNVISTEADEVGLSSGKLAKRNVNEPIVSQEQLDSRPVSSGPKNDTGGRNSKAVHVAWVLGLLLLLGIYPLTMALRSDKSTEEQSESQLVEKETIDNFGSRVGASASNGDAQSTFGQETREKPLVAFNADQSTAWVASLGGTFKGGTVSFQGADLRGEEDFSPLQGLDGINSLFLKNSKLPQKGLKGLPRSLSYLTLDHVNVKDDDLKDLHQTNLRSFSSWGCGLTDKSMKHLSKVESLKILVVPSQKLTNKGFRLISNLPYLQAICFQGALLDDRIADVFADTPSLTSIDLNNTSVGDVVLKSITTNSPNVQTLELVSTRITSQSIEELVKLKQLRSLAIASCTRLSPDAMQEFARCKNLETLNIHGLNLTNKDLLFLTELQNLRSLSVGFNPFDETGLKTIESVPSLRSLSASEMENIRQEELDRVIKVIEGRR